MRKWLLLLLILPVCFKVSGQKYGYIQTQNKYTSGFVYPGSGYKNSLVCRFSKYSKGEVVPYTPAEISAYGYGKTDFISMQDKSDTLKRFYRVIAKGDHPVYYLKNKSEKAFFITGPDNELIKLNRKNGQYKFQLVNYFEAPQEAEKYIHGFYTKRGIVKSVITLKGLVLSDIDQHAETNTKEKKALTIKQKRWLLRKKPAVSFSFQSGITFQRLPLEFNNMLPSSWKNLEANSVSVSIAADYPITKYWPLTFHQEIGFNKFVTDYKHGSEPPDYQLIQDFSVISLPLMLRYFVPYNKFTWYVNAGVQLDVALNKNNIGMLLVGTGSDVLNRATTLYYDYKTIQPGLTIGFGFSFKLSESLSLNSELRHSSIFNVLPEKTGTEKQTTIKAGISYHIFKK